MNIDTASLAPDVEFNQKMAGELMPLVGYAITSPLEFSIEITIDSLEDFMKHDQDGKVTGRATAPSLSAFPLSIVEGRMRLFVDYQDDVHVKQVQYELPMTSVEGRQFRLIGYKHLEEDNSFNCIGACAKAYMATTNLHYNLYEDGKVVGPGLLQISFWDVLTMNFSIRGKQGHRFRNYFLGNLASIYMHVFLPKKHYQVCSDPVIIPIQLVIEPKKPIRRLTRKPATREIDLQARVYTVTSQDGMECPLSAGVLHEWMDDSSSSSLSV